MRYSIVAIIDKESQQYLNNIRKYLNDNGIKCNYSVSHITLAIYKTKETSLLYDKVKNVSNKFKPFEIELNLLETFTDRVNTIYLESENNVKLSNIHNYILNNLKEIANDLDKYYTQSEWVPHCTIAKDLTVEDLKISYELLKKHLKLPIKVKLESIDIL